MSTERDARFDGYLEARADHIHAKARVAVAHAMASQPAVPASPSMAKLDMSTFSAENLARCTAPNGFNHPIDLWSLSDWMTATLGELGEAANVLKKLNRVRDGIVGNKETPEELVSMLADEIADAYIYMDLFAVAAGIDLPTAVRTKFDRTSAKIGYQPLANAEGSDDGR